MPCPAGLFVHIYSPYLPLGLVHFPLPRLPGTSLIVTISSTLSAIPLHVRVADRLDSVLMPSQYRLYPNMSQDNTLELSQAPCLYQSHSLDFKEGDYSYKFSERSCGILASESNRSFIDFDIDTSDFMNMSLPFPWDDNQCAYRYTDPYQPLRYSFESSSSTIQGSYRSMKTSLLSDPTEGIAKTQQSRESILIPDYPQDLACHHIKAYRSRPADLRTSSEESATRIRVSIRNHPSYKRSVTPSQLDPLAGALGAKSARPSHPPQRSFDSSHTQERPITPSLSFSSTLASSTASSVMSSHLESGEIASSLAAKTGLGGNSITKNLESRPDVCSPGPSSMSFGCRQVQRKISGPLPDVEYPSTMNLTASSFSPEAYKSERTFQSCCEITKPLSSTPVSLNPGTPATQAEPPSWFDLDDDTSEQPSKHPNLATKFSIPHLRLRSESSSKKTTPMLESKIKYRNEDSITIPANIVETTDLCKSRAASKVAAGQISFPSSPPTLEQIKTAQATLKKKSSVSSKPPVPAHGFTTETLKRNKSKKVKIESPRKNKKQSAARRLRCLFRRVFD